MKFKVFYKSVNDNVLESHCNRGIGFCSEIAARKAMDKLFRSSDEWDKTYVSYFVKKVNDEI